MACKKTIKSILRKARALVKKGWCQGASARNSDGKPLHSDHPDAVSYCAMGAIRAAGVSVGFPYGPIEGAALALCDAESLQGIHEIGAWNDSQLMRQADVIDAFDRAIAAA